MAKTSELDTPEHSDTEEHGDVFTDGDFCDSDENDPVRRDSKVHTNEPPIHDTVNHYGSNGLEGSHNDENANLVNGNENGVKKDTVEVLEPPNVDVNGFETSSTHVNGFQGSNGHVNGLETPDEPVTNGYNSIGSEELDGRRDSLAEQESIVGLLGKEQCQAEQRLAARRAARAEARDIRMRELERQRREQEDHADKAYDMQNESMTTSRRVAGRAIASPRRSSEDSTEDIIGLKDLRHELKEVEEKFRKAMILNAQLDNDKASFGYQLELLKDRIEDLQEEHTQLQREHREKCSALERSRRDVGALTHELQNARRAIRARDRAIAEAGFSLIDGEQNEHDDDIPALALVSAQSEQMLEAAGEGTLDVRLQKLFSERQSLESEVRRLKIALNDANSSLSNGLANGHDIYESEVEALRRACAEHKAARARAEAEGALAAGAAARLEAQLTRLKATVARHDEDEEQLKQDKRRLTREVREALNRVEELETENGHLTKRLDKLKNAKSTLLKEL